MCRIWTASAFRAIVEQLVEQVPCSSMWHGMAFSCSQISVTLYCNDGLAGVVAYLISLTAKRAFWSLWLAVILQQIWLSQELIIEWLLKVTESRTLSWPQLRSNTLHQQGGLSMFRVFDLNGRWVSITFSVASNNFTTDSLKEKMIVKWLLVARESISLLTAIEIMYTALALSIVVWGWNSRETRRV